MGPFIPGTSTITPQSYNQLATYHTLHVSVVELFAFNFAPDKDPLERHVYL